AVALDELRGAVGAVVTGGISCGSGVDCRIKAPGCGCSHFLSSWSLVGPTIFFFFPTVLVMASYIDDWSEGSIKRAVRLLSPHRLACFSDNFAKSTPSCPWDPLFLKELNPIRADTSLGQDIAGKIKRALAIPAIAIYLPN